MKKRFSLPHGLNHCQKLKKLKQKIAQLEYTLIQAEKAEKDLRFALLRQIKRTAQLEDDLQAANLRRSSTESLNDRQSKCGSNDRYEDTLFTNLDPKNTFGTVSTELMQYKYDELSLGFQRALKTLSNKDKKLKLQQQEIETLNVDIEACRNSTRWIEERTEILCCKYLSLQSRKEEEIYRLRTSLDCARQMVAYLKMSRQSNLENLIESVELRDVTLLNEMMKCDKLMLKNIQLEKQLQLLQSGLRAHSIVPSED